MLVYVNDVAVSQLTFRPATTATTTATAAAVVAVVVEGTFVLINRGQCRVYWLAFSADCLC